MLDLLLHLDQSVLENVPAVRWEPLTAVFVLASAWWVKGLAFLIAGGAVDTVSSRPHSSRVPVRALSAALALALVTAIVSAIKEAVDRTRPALSDPTVQTVVTTPDTPSFPSGHTATAFACAVAIGAICPRLRWPLIGLAALVGSSRVYLGVHYGLDVLAGAALGTAVGLASAWAMKRASITRISFKSA
jgi:membrane-associated phospholipid phosphatase